MKNLSSVINVGDNRNKSFNIVNRFRTRRKDGHPKSTILSILFPKTNRSLYSLTPLIILKERCR